MRALWIVERFPPQKGGVARAAGRQVAGLASQLGRLDVLQLTSDLAPGRIEVDEFCGATVHRLGRGARDEESHRLLLQAGLELGRAHQYDLCHGFYAVHAGYLATLVGRFLGRPAFVSLRGNDIDLGIFQGSRAPALRFTLERADALLGVSREILETVRVWTGREERLHFVPNGVDLQTFAPGEVSPEVQAELDGWPRPWVGFSGELRFKKGLSILLDLAVSFAQRGSGTLFAIGGGRSDERDGIRRWRADHADASRRFVELPYQRDAGRLACLYRAMDALVFPSLWDGMPNALLEAMACGGIVIATATGGIRDVIVDGESGFLVPLSELDVFPERVGSVLALAVERRAEVGTAARQRVVESFSAAREWETVLALYRDVLGSS